MLILEDHNHDHDHSHVEETVSHHHEHTGNFWEDFIAIATDPAHLAFELVFSIFFDLIIVALIYGVIIKKYVIPKLRKDIHKQIDAEHGLEDCHPNESFQNNSPKKTL